MGVHVKEGESVEGGRQGRQEAKYSFPRGRRTESAKALGKSRLVVPVVP